MGPPCMGLTLDSMKRKDASRFDRRLIPADPLFGMALLTKRSSFQGLVKHKFRDFLVSKPEQLA